MEISPEPKTTVLTLDGTRFHLKLDVTIKDETISSDYLQQPWLLFGIP